MLKKSKRKGTKGIERKIGRGLNVNLIMPELIKFAIVTIIFISLYLGVDKSINSLVERLDNNNKNMFEKVVRSITHYLFFFVYLFFVLNYFIDIKVFGLVLALLFLSLLLVFRKQVVSFVIGYYRIMNKVVAVNDNVVINDLHKGTIREVTLNTVKLFKGSNSVLTMPHHEIKSIEKEFEGLAPIKTKVILSNRQDPEVAESILIKLTEKLNEKFKDYLLKDEEGEIVEPFVYEGITRLNADYQGIEYSIIGNVHTNDYKELRKKLDREMAICCYKNNLKTTEHNVFFKTRLENK